MSATEVFLSGCTHLCRLLGTGLYFWLAWEVRERPGIWILLGALSGGAAMGWMEFHAVAQLYEVGTPEAARHWGGYLWAFSGAAFLLWGARRAGWKGWGWAASAAALGAAIASPRAGMPMMSLATAAMLGWQVARRERSEVEAGCLRCLGGCFLALALAEAMPPPFGEALSAACALLLPVAAILWIVRRNVFELRISRHLVLVAAMGLGSVFYLFAVRRLADEMGFRYGESRSLVEIVLILAAAFLWLPIYEWLSRWLSRRTLVHAEFTKRVIEEAASRIEMGELVPFLAERLGTTLRTSRLLLIGRSREGEEGEGLEQGVAGPAARLPAAEANEVLRECGRVETEVVHESGASGWLAEWMGRAGFHYLLPLRRQGEVIGALALDASPRRILPNTDAMLPSMAREISLLLGSARLAEQKVRLEMALAEQESRAVLGDLTATIAHEIKNPLSNIRVLTQLLEEDEEVRTRFAPDLRYIVQETDRLNSSILQLLEFARGLQQAPCEVNLSALLEKVVESMRAQAECGHLTVETRIEPGLILRQADPRGVEQVAANLLRNAMQASEEGGRVRVEALRKNGSVEVSVQDEGPGIPGELQGRIFQPFFTTRQSGTGLGLAIVAKNLRRLRGEIAVESPAASGRGTRMVVALPAGEGA